jgi:hypothetical protein
VKKKKWLIKRLNTTIDNKKIKLEKTSLINPSDNIL